MRLAGLLAPVVTPFGADGEIGRAAFRRNIQAHLRAGISGIVVAGSTGEAALLDEAERRLLATEARAVVPAGAPLLVGVGAESTRATIARARVAAECGADGVLVVAPHYYADAMTTDALRDHFTRVAEASPVPVVLYSIPRYMHFALPPELVAELATHENIVGIKDSAGDPALFARYLAAQSDGFRVLTGSGALYGDALRQGAAGAILAVALFAAAVCLAVRDAVHAGDDAGARAAQERLTPLATRIVGALGVAGVKGALDRVGLTGGAPRPPLRPLDGAGRVVLDELLSAREPAPVG